MKMLNHWGVFPRGNSNRCYVRNIIGETEAHFLVKGSKRTSTLVSKQERSPVFIGLSKVEAVNWVKENKGTYSRG